MRAAMRAIVTIAISSSAFAQTTWYVDDTGAPPGNGTLANPYTSIQYAISRPTTLNGDTVLVLPGTFGEAIDFLGKAIEVRSQNGAPSTTINASSAATSAASFKSGETSASRLQGFTLRGGIGTLVGGIRRGGGIYVSGASPRITSCVVESNVAREGGGISIGSSTATLIDVTARSNVAEISSGALDGRGGGLHLRSGANVTATGLFVHENDAGYGGGAYLSSGATLHASTSLFDINGAHGDGFLPGNGGGLFVAIGATLEMDACEVRDNVAWVDAAAGGGIYSGGTLDLDACTISANGASDVPFTYAWRGYGGGIFAFGPTSVVDSTISGNHGPLEGGGVHGGTYVNCYFSGNVSQFGGGGYLGTYTDCEFVNNLAFSTGTADFAGGVHGPATLTRCTISGSSAAGDGGAVVGATLIDCTLRDNSVSAPVLGIDGRGGAAYDCTLTSCLIEDNQAFGDSTYTFNNPGFGGALFDCVATRCVLRGNSADFGGAAVDSSLINCTLVANTNVGAPTISGAYFDAGGGGLVRNCIVSKNGPGQQIDAPASLAVTYSDVHGPIGWAGVGNLNADPKFWDELSSDFHLKPTSPCIDAGDPASPLDPDGSRADMGAFPYDPAHCSSPAAYCTAKVNSLGCVPAIGSIGLPSIGGNAFQVTATNVINNKNGLMFWSHAPNGVPFLGGTLCVAAPIVRTPVQNSAGDPPPNDCSGSYSFLFSGAYPPAHLLGPGDTVFAQYWSRDPGFAPPNNAGLSNALRFTLCL